MTTAKSDELARLLTHPLLRDLPPRVIDAISAQLVRRTVVAGGHLFHKGDQPHGWFGILEGEVRIVTLAPHGEEIVLAILQTGDWLGEVALLAGHANSHDAVARRDSRFVLVPATGFRQLLEREPQLHARFSALLAQRVRLLVDVIEDLATLPLAGRLAKRVLAMTDSDALDSAARRGRISQEEYALLVGARRQTVNRELRKWERAGWIRIDYGALHVLNRAALERCVTTGS